MTTISIPLFPLHTVLFPSGSLPLRIFEPRYLDMISTCMKTEEHFGICLIKEGTETGKAALTHETGTLCGINYFNTDSNGVLCITAFGKQRFTIKSKQVQRNQLIIAEVSLLPNEPQHPIEDKFSPAVDMLRKLLEQLGYPYAKMDKKYDDASWVSGRLVELLPLQLEQKQSFLEQNNPVQRLEQLWQLMKELDLR